jgi:probable HAF family extracellular repeat protein
MVFLGDFPGGAVWSGATGVSSDGSVVVGWGEPGGYVQMASHWTAASGMVELGTLAGGSGQSSSNAVSSDGLVVVGGSSSASGYEAFRWTAGGGMVGLGDLPGGSFSSGATERWSLSGPWQESTPQNRPKRREVWGTWRGGRDSNPQLPA